MDLRRDFYRDFAKGGVAMAVATAPARLTKVSDSGHCIFVTAGT